MSTHNLCLSRNMIKKKNQSFLYENFQYLEVKFSIYLNRRVFVKLCVNTVCIAKYRPKELTRRLRQV